MLRQVTIVGASLAGVSAADKLRSLGYDGELIVIGAESDLPYDRPPLSKGGLSGDVPETPSLLRSAEHYTEFDIGLCLGVPARSLDLKDRSIELVSGKRYHFGGLVLACGARPRAIESVNDLAGIHVLRTADDCLRLRAALGAASNVAVIGAGLIGSEVASTARSLGLSVTLIESGATPMPRVVGPSVGRFCAAMHRDHGVNLVLGLNVSAFVGTDCVKAVQLSDGSLVPADVVVLGIGAEPSTEWLAGSGLSLSDGIVCDERCCAAPDVFAAGDVARWLDKGTGSTRRVEHWANAVAQGETAARNLVGHCSSYTADDYFWSDQFGQKFQFAGCTSPDCSERVFQRDGQRRRMVALYGKARRLCGVVAFDWPAMLLACRRLLASEESWERAQEIIAEKVGASS